MLKIIAIVVIALVAIVAVVLVLASRKPDTFRVERSTTIDAPPERIVAAIDDFHRWTAWSPWERLDPTMKRTYDGAARGVGAIYAWNGNGKVGEGRMEILESTPQRVAIDLRFERPMKAHNRATFTLVPHGAATDVTWVMEGPSPFMAKVMHVFMDMDTMVGKDFATGLADLKRVSESAAATAAP